MRKATAYLAVSLDGYIADPAGGVGWLDEFAAGQSEDGYAAFAKTVDTVVMGGRTYRQIVTELSPDRWVYEGMDAWVWTRDPAPLRFARRIEGDLGAWLRARKRQTGKDIWLCGGAQLIAAAAAAGEVDRWHLTVLPVLLGGGTRLFPEGAPQALRLCEVRRSGGIAEMIYEKIDENRPCNAP